MKKAVLAVLCTLLVLTLVGCGTKNTKAPNAPVSSFVFQGTLYCSTGKQIPAEIDDTAITGTVTAVVSPSQWPKQEGEANFGEVGTPFALTDEGMVSLLEQEWTVFEGRELP